MAIQHSHVGVDASTAGCAEVMSRAQEMGMECLCELSSAAFAPSLSISSGDLIHSSGFSVIQFW